MKKYILFLILPTYAMETIHHVEFHKSSDMVSVDITGHIQEHPDHKTPLLPQDPSRLQRFARTCTENKMQILTHSMAVIITSGVSILIHYKTC